MSKWTSTLSPGRILSGTRWTGARRKGRRCAGNVCAGIETPFPFFSSCARRGEPAKSERQRARINGRIGKIYHINTLSTDRKSTRLNSSHQIISYAVFCLKKKKHRKK